MKLMEMFPKGSVVDREEIRNAYILLSPSMHRLKRSGGRTGRRSIPASRGRRGVVHLKEMVKMGYWTEKKEEY